MESALDVQMASAACPTCRILFVQLPRQDGVAPDLPVEDVATSHFATGVKTAVRLGAKGVNDGREVHGTLPSRGRLGRGGGLVVTGDP